MILRAARAVGGVSRPSAFTGCSAETGSSIFYGLVQRIFAAFAFGHIADLFLIFLAFRCVSSRGIFIEPSMPTPAVCTENFIRID